MKKTRTLKIDDIIIRLRETPAKQDRFNVLKETEVEGLCSMARCVLQEQPMLVELEAPVQICGDIHGQYQDLLTIFRIFGSPEEKNYLFLGDYVDRGKQSLECILLLLAYKIKYPQSFFLLRGNHQSCELNKLYGFFDECKRRLSFKAWKTISDTFNFLPIAAVVGERVFCVHGGLSPLIKNLSALNSIRRPIEILDNKLIADILWADPKPGLEGWQDNAERGISYYYGKNVVDYFLAKNQFDLICRSHQVVEEGYEFTYDRKIITVFSAPNYCSEFVNLAAVLKVGSDLLCKIQQFEGQPIPVNKRKRSVTPIRMSKEVENTSPNKSSKQSRDSSVDLRKRKATKVLKSVLNKQQNPPLQVDPNQQYFQQ